MQRLNLHYLGLWLREFLHPQNKSGFLTPEGLKFSESLDSPSRLYVAVSHALIHFELIKFPAALPSKKLITAARLEALRLYRLLEQEKEDFLLALWPKSQKEVIAFFLKRTIIQKTLASLPENQLLSGLFPAFISLWAFVLKEKGALSDGLYFVRTPWSYEGFYVQDKRPVGIMPAVAGAAEAFLKYFEGPIHELAGDPLEIIMQGTLLVPEFFNRDVPCFEGFPLKVRPKINYRLLYLWFLPLLLFVGTYPLNVMKGNLQQKLTILEKELSQTKKKYEQLEKIKKNLEEEQKLAQALKDYLPEHRPPLLEALLELTQKLPKDSWIRKLSFSAPNVIRIWGESQNALKLLEALSSSPLFKEVKFTSTVTKNPRTGKETFSMELQLNWPKLSE